MAATDSGPGRMFDLTGRVALVTGGSRGIGAGCSLALARAGADICINYLSDHKEAQAVADAVAAMGRRATIVRGDVSSAKDVRRMVKEAVRQHGEIDVLVNNAGILSSAPFLEMKEEMWEKVLAVNLKGQFLVAQAVARHMVARKGRGRIINIASIASGGVGVGFPGIAHYTASKGGVIALTETMAIELAPHGITANAVAPGVIDTPMTSGMLDDKSTREGMLGRVPVGRVGRPEDIGAMVAFLASEEASYCTGATFYVDGGWLAS